MGPWRVCGAGARRSARRSSSRGALDAARNAALRRVPEDADICVSTDLDEVFEPGWRAALESAWKPEHTRATYLYTWAFRADGRPDPVSREKIHRRLAFAGSAGARSAALRRPGRRKPGLGRGARTEPPSRPGKIPRTIPAASGARRRRRPRRRPRRLLAGARIPFSRPYDRAIEVLKHI